MRLKIPAKYCDFIAQIIIFSGTLRMCCTNNQTTGAIWEFEKVKSEIYSLSCQCSLRNIESLSQRSTISV